MHTTIHATPQYGGSSAPDDAATGIDTLDIWDASAPDAEPHDRFTGDGVQVYDIPRPNGTDHHKFKLPRAAYDSSSLANTLASNPMQHELFATDENGDTYAGTVVKSVVRRRDVYVYIEQDVPMGPQRPGQSPP